jgi:hypothetical protein
LNTAGNATTAAAIDEPPTGNPVANQVDALRANQSIQALIEHIATTCCSTGSTRRLPVKVMEPTENTSLPPGVE